MRCAVITPIGPGHAGLYEEARASIRAAAEQGRGPFSEILELPVDDTQAKLGRSKARNLAVQQAVERGAEWLFFLDADDLLMPDAFLRVQDAVGTHDAIWGAICEQQAGSGEAWKLRAKQDLPLGNVYDVLSADPFYTLQMGHFVRSAVAAANPFDETLDTGEDFDYYLRVWLRSRCTKLPHPFFINRRGQHSTGPRSATGVDWRKNVVRVMSRFVAAHGTEIRAILVREGRIPGP